MIEAQKGRSCDSIRCGQRETCISKRLEQREAGRKAFHLTTCITASHSENLAGSHQTTTDQHRHKDQIRSTNETTSKKHSEKTATAQQTQTGKVRITTKPGKISFQDTKTNAILDFFVQDSENVKKQVELFLRLESGKEKSKLYNEILDQVEIVGPVSYTHLTLPTKA